MTIEELIKKLGLDETNAEILRKFAADKDAEITKKVADLNAAKTKVKDEAKKAKELATKMETVYDTLGIEPDTEDIEEAIQAALKGQSNDPALQKQINKLKSKIADQEKEFNDKFTQERGKRFENMKRAALIEALTANDADDPALLVDLLINKVKVNEEDETLTFNDDKNSKVGDYVKEFLVAHPKLVANKQNAGAGGVPGGNTGAPDNENQAFAKKMAESNKVSADSVKALDSYFA